MQFSDNKKAQDSQRAIYKGIRKILKRKELNDITIVDIEKECNVSRSTFYRNYRNIYDVFDVIFKWYYEEYETLRLDEKDQLDFFFKYWSNHKDLVTIIIDNNIDVLKNCIIKYTKNKNTIYIETKYNLTASIITLWSKKYNKISYIDYKKLTIDALGKEFLKILIE